MYYDAVQNKHGLKHDPFKALVAPRPIGWISTLSEQGVVNLAPYSFFNGVATDPPYVMFSSSERKDSLTNAEQSGEFVCSLATYDLREQMNITAAHVGPDVDEMELAGLEAAPSHFVKPPRVKNSPAALECTYFQTIELPGTDLSTTSHYMVIGKVVGIYINDNVIHDGMVDVRQMQTIARLGYMDYLKVDDLFSITRPK